MFERCCYCRRLILFGAKNIESRIYCSLDCANYAVQLCEGFCQSCTDETLDESAGNMKTLNGSGTTWSGLGVYSSDVCPECGSSVLEKVEVFGGIPVKKYGKYRVLYVSKTSYLSRKVKSG